MKHCPKCDANISDSYQPAEPDVGIPTTSWHCDICNLTIYDDSDGSDDYNDEGWRD